MSTDPFIRQRVNQLTGLTVYGQEFGTPTSVVASTWTPLEVVFTQSDDSHRVLTAYKITADKSDFTFRMMVDGVKIFPHADDVEVLSGVDMFLQFQIQIPATKILSLEVFSPTGGIAILDYLSTITVQPYDFS